MKHKALCVLIAPVVAVGGFTLWPRSGAASAEQGKAAATTAQIEAAPTPAATAESDFIELHAALEQGAIRAEFIGNGREKMRATLTNLVGRTVRIKAEAGQMLTSGRNAVVIVRAGETVVAAGKSVEFPLQTAATRSTNKIKDAVYLPSYSQPQRIAALLPHIQTRHELSAGAIQTAVLALTENLPLNAVSKFTPATVGLKSRFNTDAFRVDAAEVIAALTALREIGVADASIAMTIDPQLKIESMIEPLSRAAAMRYYGLTSETEWEYWKTELLTGDVSTRHYALYGIARFYPNVALEMLPKWARQVQTAHVFRLSAIQALADTQRREALGVLNELADELGTETELGRAARGAAEYLDARLGQMAITKNAIAFRSSKALSQF